MRSRRKARSEGLALPHKIKIELSQVHAATEGTDARTEVSVRHAGEGRSVTARGADPDTLVASAKAYLGALKQADGAPPARRRHGQRGQGALDRVGKNTGAIAKSASAKSRRISAAFHL